MRTTCLSLTYVQNLIFRTSSGRNIAKQSMLKIAQFWPKKSKTRTVESICYRLKFETYSDNTMECNEYFLIVIEKLERTTRKTTKFQGPSRVVYNWKFLVKKNGNNSRVREMRPKLECGTNFLKYIHLETSIKREIVSQLKYCQIVDVTKQQLPRCDLGVTSNIRMETISIEYSWWIR